MTKGPLLQDVWDALPEDRKAKIKARAKTKIQAYRNLEAIRKAAGLTQAKIAQELDMPQGNISRLEKNSDMLLSTLQRYIEAAGGKLNLTVEFPGKPPIPLSGLGDLIENGDGVKHPHL